MELLCLFDMAPSCKNIFTNELDPVRLFLACVGWINLLAFVWIARLKSGGLKWSPQYRSFEQFHTSHENFVSLSRTSSTADLFLKNMSGHNCDSAYVSVSQRRRHEVSTGEGGGRILDRQIHPPRNSDFSSDFGFILTILKNQSMLINQSINQSINEKQMLI